MEQVKENTSIWWAMRIKDPTIRDNLVRALKEQGKENKELAELRLMHMITWHKTIEGADYWQKLDKTTLELLPEPYCEKQGYGVGDWVEVLDTANVRKFNSDAIGHRFQLEITAVESLNGGDVCVEQPVQKYGVNYMPADLKKVDGPHPTVHSTPVIVSEAYPKAPTMEQKYEVGQWVVVIKGETSTNNVGDIRKITSKRQGFLCGKTQTVYNLHPEGKDDSKWECAETIRPALPHEIPSTVQEYKVGQRVIVHSGANIPGYNGKKGEVVEIVSDKPHIRVKFDNGGGVIHCYPDGDVLFNVEILPHEIPTKPVERLWKIGEQYKTPDSSIATIVSVESVKATVKWDKSGGNTKSAPIPVSSIDKWIQDGRWKLYTPEPTVRAWKVGDRFEITGSKYVIHSEEEGEVTIHDSRGINMGKFRPKHVDENWGTYWIPYNPEPVMVTLENAVVGMKVVRGRDWDLGEGSEGIGEIVRVLETGNRGHVKWSNQLTGEIYHRWGFSDQYELYVAPGETVTSNNTNNQSNQVTNKPKTQTNDKQSNSSGSTESKDSYSSTDSQITGTYSKNSHIRRDIDTISTGERGESYSAKSKVKPTIAKEEYREPVGCYMYSKRSGRCYIG